jgi:hypothetical protein
VLIFFGYQRMTLLYTVTQSALLASINRLDIDIDKIVDRLQALTTQNSNFFTPEEVKVALLNWLQHHIESIESDPEWFINQNPKHFTKHLDFDRLQEEAAIEEGYDFASTAEQVLSDREYQIHCGF